VYSVARIGANVSTTHKFSVQLLPGELVVRNLVVGSDNQEFVGFYPPLQLSARLAQGVAPWKTQWQLSASTLFNTDQNNTGENHSNVSLSAQIDSRSVYNSTRHYASLRLLVEEGFAKKGKEAFQVSIDELEFRLTYIYRLSPRIGPYLRGVVNTRIFDTHVRYDSPQTLYLLSAEGDTARVLTGVSEFTLSPPFSPLQLKQGVGINSQLYRSFPFNVNLRVGVGARQSYLFDTYDLSQGRTTPMRLMNTFSKGLEALVITDVRLTRYAILDSEFDLLMPSSTYDTWEFSWENRLRLALTRFLNTDVVFDFNKDKSVYDHAKDSWARRYRSNQQVLLRLVYLL
jgi:hypothetical protein